MSVWLAALLGTGLPVTALPAVSVQQTPLTSHRSPLTAPEPGSELTVTLITFEPAGMIWERFGHNAIWIHNAATGLDDLYDYGRFSFGLTKADQVRFIGRFIQGRMWYSMGYETQVRGLIQLYARQGRKIWAQELNIVPAARLKLRDFLAWNYQPEHAGYAYDYYRDNCSTRIRDALDAALGGAIRRYGALPSGMTWRDETRRLNQHNVLLYTALLIVLGQPVDAGMSRWEQMFLPMRLRQHLDSVTVAGLDGAAHPAVTAERVLAEGGRWPVPDLPSNWLAGYAIAGILAGALLAGLGRTRGFMPLATLWMLLVGLLGGFMTWVWLFSLHLAGYRNENLFLFNLFALALAIALPAAVRRKPWAVRPAGWLSAAVVGLGALGLIVKLVPGFPQHNGEVIALILPLHAGVWLGLRRAVSGER